MKKTQRTKESIDFLKLNPLPFSKYKKLVESIKYKDFSIELSDVAKYPGQFFLEYKYQITCPNWEGSCMPGARIIFPAKVPFKNKLFPCSSFDLREQLSKTALKKWLKETADIVRYKNPKYA